MSDDDYGIYYDDYQYEQSYQIEEEIQQEHDEEVNYIQIIAPNHQNDDGFEVMMGDYDIHQIEQYLTSDPDRVTMRLGRVFNTIINILEVTTDELPPENARFLEQLVELFIHQNYIQEFYLNLPKHIGIKIEITKQTIDQIISMIIEDRDLLKQYLTRLLIFMLKPSKPFVGTISSKNAQIYVLQKIESVLFDDEFQNTKKLDIIALAYLTNTQLHNMQLTTIAGILANVLESFLDSEDYSDQIKSTIINIVQLLITLSTNESILKSLFTSNLHKSIYKSIKFASTQFTQGQEKGWAKEPIVVDTLVALIIRILSIGKPDIDYYRNIFDDFIFLIDQRRFDFIYRVLIPMLNSETSSIAAVCYHKKIPLDQLKLNLQEFVASQQSIQNSNKASNNTQYINSIHLNQELKIQLSTMIPDLLKQIPKVKRQKSVHFAEQMDVEIETSPSKLDKNQIKQQQLQILNPNQIEQEEEIQDLAGQWVNLHKFDISNPQFDFKTIIKAMGTADNALFIFNLMCGPDNVKLITFFSQLSKDNNGNCIQAKSSSLSFYMVQFQNRRLISHLKDELLIALDIQQTALQISAKMKPVVCMHFSDFQTSKFGFPFPEQGETDIQIEQLKSQFEEDTYLLGVEIWTYSYEGKDQDGIPTSSLNNRSYDEQLNHYLSEFRLEKIELVRNSKYNPNIINDIYEPIENNPRSGECTILEDFEKQIQGVSGIIQHLAQNKRANFKLMNFFRDMDCFLKLPGFPQQIMKQDGFLQIVIMAHYLSDSKSGIAHVNKANSAMFQALSEVLKNVTFDRNILIIVAAHLRSLIDEKGQSTHLQGELKDLFKTIGQPQPKGKAKGIGYGDSNYNKFVPKQVPQAVVSKSQNTYEEEFISSIFQCLSMIFRVEDTAEVFHMINQSSILGSLRMYLSQCLVSKLRQDDIFPHLISILKGILIRDNFLLFFVDGNPNLFSILDKLRIQTEICMRTDGTDKNLQELLDVFEYAEASLMARGLVQVTYKTEAVVDVSMQQFYRQLMKPLAVGKCAIENQPEFQSLMGNCLKQCTANPQTKMQRIISEITSIDEHLPLEATNSIFIRYDVNRMDCMRIMIFGASGTPYAHGGFLYEMLFMDDYPKRPPKVLLSTTGHGKVRFNPNLYNCGKVCLSLLGTWGDNWIADFSTILQILISIQSMVMSEYVMFNEPGWESQMGTPDGENKNRGYCNFIRIQNIRYAMIEQMQKPPEGFQEVVRKSFFLRRDMIIKEVEQWIAQAELPAVYTQTQNNCAYQAKPSQYKADLIQIYEELKKELMKLGIIDFRNTTLTKSYNYVGQLLITKPKIQTYQMPKSLPINIENIDNQEVARREFDPNDAGVQNLMSRYIGVLGIEAVKSQSQAVVLLCTLNALGVEIAKNIILSGVKKLYIFDDQIVDEQNLYGQFYLTANHLNWNRAQACKAQLQSLNPYVIVEVTNTMVECDIIVTQDPEFASNCGRRVVLVQQRSVFGRIINDFQRHTIIDADGEALQTFNIESIVGRTVSTTTKCRLSDGDLVELSEVQERGNAQSYNGKFKISNVKQKSFDIDIANSNIYITGGQGITVKQPQYMQFANMRDSLRETQNDPQLELIHRMFNVEIRNFPWTIESLAELQQASTPILQSIEQANLNFKLSQLIPTLTLLHINTQFPALAAYFGAIAAQEVLKALTQKYTPLITYIEERLDLVPYLADISVFPTQYTLPLLIDQHGLTNTGLQSILGDISYLNKARIFTVGAGAIGCELLKNFAMAEIGTTGQIYLTDPDLIENSNLNRQFLFREKHIRKPKSTTAAGVVLTMNPNLKITARLDRVALESQDIYHDEFFKSLDCVCNALDNVQARLYIDSRCVSNCIPLLESGTLGSKGHVQVIIPHVTECYADRQDPEDNEDVPYCTLKMFPENQLHCLEWARDKFEQYFVRKPQAIMMMSNMDSMSEQSLGLALRTLKKIPRTFADCVTQARIKFEKLFRWNIISLLTAYPLDSRTKEGKLFWSAPKRVPLVKQDACLRFIEDYAVLTAQVYNVPIPVGYNLQELVNRVIVPEFQLKQDKLKQIQASVEKQTEQVIPDKNAMIKEAKILLSKLKIQVSPQEFEKDDDSNRHVSFIMAATNARAENYTIHQVDWLWCKLKAGRIIPAMATTTSCISALQTLELIKILKRKGTPRNTFLNLAIPMIMNSEPGECSIKVVNDIKVSIWYRYQMTLPKLTEPLLFVLKALEKVFGKIVTIHYGAKPLYIEQLLPKKEDERLIAVNTAISALVPLPCDISVTISTGTVIKVQLLN